MLTPRQAQFIRIGFQTTPGWEELAETNPRFVQALEALPDETILRRCNVMLQEMFDDVKREAFSLAKMSEDCIELHAEVVLLRDRLNSLRYAVADVLTEWEERWRRPGDDDPVMEALRKAAGFPGEPPAVDQIEKGHGDR